MSSFYESLESGKEIERLVLSTIKKKYPTAYIIEGYYKYYDIFIPEKNIYVGMEELERVFIWK